MTTTEKKVPKILITWGLGYIGAHTAIIFGQAGYDVIIIDNLSNSYIDTLGKIKELSWKTPNFYDADLKDEEEIKKILSEHKDIEWIIHFAGKKAVGESCQDPFLYYDNNIVGSINLLKAMGLNKIKNIVFSSTATVYDSESSLPPFAEKDTTNPQNPYATSKVTIELILKDMARHQDVNAISLRYFNPIGAHHSGKVGENPKWIPGNLVPFIYKVAKWDIENVKIFGNDYNTKDGTGIRDYLHVMDLAEAHLLAIQYINEFSQYKKDKINEKKGLYDDFNIGTWEGHSVKEIIHLVEKVTERRIPNKVTRRRQWDVATLIANSQKAKQVLWRDPKRSVYQAIEDGRKFAKNN